MVKYAEKSKSNLLWKRFIAYCSTPTLVKRTVARIITYIILLDLAYVFLYPFMYMVVTSLKTNADLYDATVNWVPHSIKWANFTMAFKAIDFTTGLKNSIIITFLCTIGHLASCAAIGYGMARYKFKGQNVLFAILLLSIVIPTQTIIVPLYLTSFQLGLVEQFSSVSCSCIFWIWSAGRFVYFRIPTIFPGSSERVGGCRQN